MERPCKRPQSGIDAEVVISIPILLRTLRNGEKSKLVPSKTMFT